MKNNSTLSMWPSISRHTMACVVMLVLRSPALILLTGGTEVLHRRLLGMVTGEAPVAPTRTYYTHIDLLITLGLRVGFQLLIFGDDAVRRLYRTVLLTIVLPQLCHHVSDWFLTNLIPGAVCSMDTFASNMSEREVLVPEAVTKPFTTLQNFIRDMNHDAFGILCNITSNFVHHSCKHIVNGDNRFRVASKTLSNFTSIMMTMSSFARLCRLGRRGQRLAAMFITLPYAVAPILVVLGQPDCIVTTVARTVQEYTSLMGATWLYCSFDWGKDDETGNAQNDEVAIEEVGQNAPNHKGRVISAFIASWIAAVPVFVADEILKEPQSSTDPWQLLMHVATGSLFMYGGATAVASRTSGFIAKHLTRLSFRNVARVQLQDRIVEHLGLMMLCLCLFGKGCFVQSALYLVLHGLTRDSLAVVRQLLIERIESFTRDALVTIRLVLTVIVVVPPIAFRFLFSVLVLGDVTDRLPSGGSFRDLCLVGLLPLLSLSYEALFAMIRLTVGLPKGPGRARTAVVSEFSVTARRGYLMFEVFEELGQLIIYCAFGYHLYAFKVECCRETACSTWFSIGIYLALVYVCYLVLKQALKLKPKAIHRVAALPQPSVDEPRLSDLCAVCMTSMTADTARKTRCGHVFHLACLAMCVDVDSSCPMCRGNIF